MIMRAREQGNVVVLELEGHLDVETTAQFQDMCLGILKKDTSKRVILNMERLKFVGSTGINQFVDAIKAFNKCETKPKICKVSNDFLMILRAYQTTRNPFEIFDNEATAEAAFDAPPPPPKKITKKKQIEN